jgi:dTDP-L-rhamnose 4-epimerase
VSADRQRVLITGGAGFIGSHTADRLLKAGYSVRVYDKLVDQVHDGLGPRHLSGDAEFINGDMQDRDRLAAALSDVDMILHLAAEVGVGQSMYEISRYVEANTAGTAGLLDILANRQHKVSRIVVASSMSVYGEGAYICPNHGDRFPRIRSIGRLESGIWELPCSDCGEALRPVPTSETKPMFPTSVYAISKMDQELLTLTVAEARHIGAVALRYFNVYGTRQALSNPYTGVAAIFCARLLNGQPPLVFEDGLQRRDLIHVSDVARANQLALESTVTNVALNIGTGESRTVSDLAQILGKALDLDLEPQPVGGFRLGDIRHCWANTAAARESLGFEWSMPFEDGVGELIDWVAQQQSTDNFDHAKSELVSRGLIR